jgi:nitroimidazol reductase NimA-like FMN-containing flavoprotein (pyridoxamine 5'-phosphate oxidase superfamily)
MEVVEDSLDTELDDVLSRPLFCHLSTVSKAGDPRVSPLWFLWEEGTLWIIADSENTYPERVIRHPETAVAVVDSDPETGRVEHVGFRGRATVEPFDPERAERLLSRYLGDERSEWDQRFVGLPEERWQLIRFEPETVVARDQSYAV